MGPRRSVNEKLALLELARRLRNIARACRALGFSRDSYYRVKRDYERTGEVGLVQTARQRPLHKNRVAPAVEAAVLELSRHEPSWGQAAVAAQMRQRGLAISAAGVRCVWLRHGLQTADRRRAWCSDSQQA